MSKVVELAIHEWPPPTEHGADGRVAVLVHGITGWRHGSDIVVLDGGHTLHRDRFDEYVATVLDFIG